MSGFNFINVNNGFSTIINELNSVMTYFEDENREIPTNLSIKERRDYTNNLFDKMEVIDSYKSEVIQLKERLRTFYYSLSGEKENCEDDDNASNEQAVDNSSILTCNEVIDSSVESEVSIKEEDNIYQHNMNNTENSGTEAIFLNDKPSRVIFQGKRYMVEDWTDVVIVICETIIDKSPKMMDMLANDSSVNSFGSKNLLFSYDWKEIRLPRKRLSNGLYVKSGLYNENAADICNKIFEKCGYKLDDLKIKFSSSDNGWDDSDEIEVELSAKLDQNDDVQINNVGEEFFDDPTKLLEWLDKTNKL